MNPKSPPTLILPLALALTAATTGLVHSQEVEFIAVGKDIRYVQTGPSTLIVDPQEITGLYGGPYGFGAGVEGVDLDSLDPPTLTPPPGTPDPAGSPFYNDLFYNEDDSAWRYGPTANDWGALSQAVIDSKFPNGTYTLRVDGTSVVLSLTGNAYPNTPQLTLSGGTWVNGKYAMDAANPLTVTTNVFAQYGSNVDGHIGLWINDETVADTFASSSPATNFASHTVPGSTLPTNQVTSIDADFAAFVSNGPALPTAYAAAYYAKSVTLEVFILPKVTAQSSSQVLAPGASEDLQVTATGTPATASGRLNYQWRKDGADIPGATMSSFGLVTFTSAKAGTYTCTVTNDVGSITSQPIYLELGDAFRTYVASFGLNSVTTGAPAADYDRDGIPNLLEYLFGGNPTLPGSGLLPALTKAPGSANLVFTYKRKLAATGVTQVIEHSPNLSAPWTPAIHGQNGVTISMSPVDAATEQVSVTIPGTGPTRFVRLKAFR